MLEFYNNRIEDVFGVGLHNHITRILKSSDIIYDN